MTLKPVGKNTQGFPKDGCPFCGGNRLYGPQISRSPYYDRWLCLDCDKKFEYNTLDDIYVNPDGTKIEKEAKNDGD